MAKITGSGWDEAYKAMERLGKKTPQIMEKMITKAADTYKESTKVNIAASDLVDTGALFASVKVDKPKAERDGFSIDVYPQGNRIDEHHPHGERNETIAFILEHDEKRGGYMEKAAEEAAEPAIAAMMKVLEDETDAN